MRVEQGLPFHPVATGLAGHAIPFAIAASHVHTLPSPPFWFPVPAVLVASPALPCPSSLSAVLALVPQGVAPPFCVSMLLLPLYASAPRCPFRAPTPVPPACPPPYEDFTSPYNVDCPVRGWPCCHPRGGHLPVSGAQPPPLWSAWAPCRGRGGGGLLMARSACTAFGGCCSARTSWFPCGMLCVVLGLVSLPCVGRLFAQLLCCPHSSQFWALSSSAGTLTAAGVRRRGGGGGAACGSLPPIAAVGLSHFQLGGTRGTGHLCTCLHIYKLTCHRCLLGLFWGKGDVLLLFCILGR